MDIDHIEWFMETAQMVCDIEGLDDTLLLPLAILHDVGYSKVKDVGTANYYDTNIREAHMQAGRDITIEILKQVNYPPDKIERIAHMVAIHDNWAFGEVEIYVNDPVLGTFKDLDYLWIFTEKGCLAIQKVLGKNDTEMLEHLRNEASPIGGKKPYSNATTHRLHDEYLAAREIELTANTNPEIRQELLVKYLCQNA